MVINVKMTYLDPVSLSFHFVLLAQLELVDFGHEVQGHPQNRLSCVHYCRLSTLA